MNWPTPENIINPSTSTEWPKWVAPHESHVVRKKADGAPDHVSVTDFADFHVDRVTGEVTVMVKDEEDERRAAAELKAEEPVADPEPLVADDVVTDDTDTTGEV